SLLPPTREYPDYDAYKTPEYFSSDWLNEYWDAIAVDDYRFDLYGANSLQSALQHEGRQYTYNTGQIRGTSTCYSTSAGVNGALTVCPSDLTDRKQYTWLQCTPFDSRTPFHADVFRSYSWSANICGRKKWLLFPPGSEGNLRDCHGNLPYDVTSPTLQDPKLYLNYQKCCPPIEVTQEAGEIIFVPSGWHHQVYNVIDTISINHNWVNGCNVAVMWRFLQKELTAVQREIAEWKDTMDGWDQHCQVIMKSCTGIDYTEFYTFLKMIAQRRLEVLETNGVDLPAEGRMTPGPRHALFDLEKIADVLSTLIDDVDFQKLDVETFDPPPKQLLRRLKMVIDPKSCAVRCV
ncbi:hypothetical protein AB205_0046260, partial [Aquarana catesbeiana]